MGLLANLDYEVQKYFHESENECNYLQGYDIASNCLETIAFFSKETLDTTIDILLKYNFDKEITCYYTDYDGNIITAEGKIFCDIEEGENEHTIMLTEIMNGTNIGDFNQIFYKLDEVLNFWLLKELGLNETNYQFYNLCWQSSEPETLLNLIKFPNQSTDQQLQIDSLQAEIEHLKAENERLTAELNQANNRIAELETQTTKHGMKLKGIDLVNYDKAKVQLFAKVVAKSVWQMDTTNQIKSGDMVQYIKSLLLQLDDKNLPETDKTISDWLKDIKPDYAKQGGRIPKDAPTEIPLTFKK